MTSLLRPLKVCCHFEENGIDSQLLFDDVMRELGVDTGVHIRTKFKKLFLMHYEDVAFGCHGHCFIISARYTLSRKNCFLRVRVTTLTFASV